ncbi:PhzF family phenazine biosynthesis protein [Cocleimonas flava]|uniref:PhzF family phenazine biosynthesis protein n=1 Tax=Cocleimonas flava TaxID=634765 RepID=A0A4R1F5D1_9GAMM|nr:PhzF family phenazine biosynthesis protein [Cocleimonas flava]TCJ87824.1 PhzF family phenazine biosynthesis protein [Cocleimonas flava]
MSLIRIAAFSDGDIGGNPAGVHISDEHPSTAEMQKIAAEVGYSETVFAKPLSKDSSEGWRVRYFSPESEVPFCGHATIALGAALAMQHGAGVYPLQLNETNITVEGFADGDTNSVVDTYSAALQSPNTRSEPADPAMINEALALFGYTQEDLDSKIPPAFANGGANHLIIGLNSREALSAMDYDLDAGRSFMNKAGLVTVMFAYAETPQIFHTRNPFASGGVFEDPATGAATAAFAGYLRDLEWPNYIENKGEINIIQGEDMGARSLIHAEFTEQIGSSIRVSGATRII